jgi:pantoate--beta-alanine ligase
MIVARDLAELGTARARFEAEGKTVGLVPTMGALHAGHLSLMTLARRHCDVLIVSIFVNPLQFGPSEDYAHYPRTLEADLAACERVGVDVVFTPAVTDLYPAGRSVTISAGGMGAILEGASRPGHFDGALTVVAKLFNLVRPHAAVFGQKDAQQLACIRRMVIDLNFPIMILAAPTVREEDGLALSSRNRYLTAAERASALALSRALRAAGTQLTPSDALRAGRAVLDAEPGVELDYLSLVQPGTLAEVPPDYTGESLLLVAGLVGSTRLIDNAELAFQPLPEAAPSAPASQVGVV